MTSKLKLSVAALALATLPAAAFADSIAVSLSANFAEAGAIGTPPNAIIIDPGAELDVDAATLTVSAVSNVSVAAATGENAAANTAAAKTADAEATFANAGAGPDLVTSGQLGDFVGGTYEAAVSFGVQ